MIFYEYNHKQTIRRKILHRDIGSLMQKQTEEVLVNGELYTYMHTKKFILVTGHSPENLAHKAVRDVTAKIKT